MGWDVSRTTSYGTKPSFPSATSPSGKPDGGQNPLFDLTRPQPATDTFSQRIVSEVNQHKAEHRAELEAHIQAKQQEQEQMTAVRNQLKEKMEHIKAERSRLNPVHDRQKLEELNDQECQAKSEDRLAYFGMDNNYQMMLSDIFAQGRSF